MVGFLTSAIHQFGIWSPPIELGRIRLIRNAGGVQDSHAET